MSEEMLAQMIRKAYKSYASAREAAKRCGVPLHYALYILGFMSHDLYLTVNGGK